MTDERLMWGALTILLLAAAVLMLCRCSATPERPRWVVNDQRVEWQEGTDAGYAEAVLDPRRPRIRIGRLFDEQGDPIKDFILRHELCHLLTMTDDELAADRCAVRMMDDDRILLASDVATIALWVAGHDDQNHPAGALRSAVVIVAGLE